jgi:gluconolactonase
MHKVTTASITATQTTFFALAVACSSGGSNSTSHATDGGSPVDAGDASTTQGADSATADAGSDTSADAGSGDGGDGGGARWTCPAGPFGSPIPAGATPTRITAVPPSDAFNNSRSSYTTIEGPVWIGDALYVSEFLGSPNPPPSRILEVTVSGSVSVAMVDSGSNGLAVDNLGTLYGAVHADGSISRFDLSAGTRTPIVTSYMGARFNSPNDLALRQDGTIYFSDPTYQASNPPPQSQTRVYRVAPGTNAVSVVDATLTQPNGVTLSLDETTLYVTSTKGLYAYPVMADGSTGAPTAFAANLNGDGMVIDCAGNLYVAEIGTGNVEVLSPAGASIGELSVTGVGAVTNVAFGGTDHKTLYISAQGGGGEQGLFDVVLNIPGMPY